MQHFRLTLECGHFLETSCVDDLNGVPHEAKYVRQTMPSPPVRCCDGSHVVTEQFKIPRLTGAQPGSRVGSDAGWGDQAKTPPTDPAPSLASRIRAAPAPILPREPAPATANPAPTEPPPPVPAGWRPPWKSDAPKP